MKLWCEKKMKKFLTAVIVAAFTILLSGCGEKASLEGRSFLEDTVSIEKYETYTMSLSGTEDKDITWKSENESVATVEDGVVYAKKKGTATILACKGDASISCEVVVTDNQYVPVIELSEPETGINLVQDETYILNPVVSYNGNTYTDAKFTYSVKGDGIWVDASGVVNASDLGSSTVCVKAVWRDNEIETSLPISVIDVSTSIEVDGTNFVIYKNGEGDEYPSQVDLGVVVFEDKVKVEKPHASVKYVERATEDDVEGAATIKNGVAYAGKLGTTHFVAEYKTESDATIYTKEFAVTVKQTPADLYMTPIVGEDFEFFWEPIGADNSVEWDENLRAFHLINKTAKNSDDRGFIINRDYLANIIKYTKAESISFEFKTDDIASGLKSDDKSIYQGFYPDWWGTDDITKTATSDKWTKVEIYFDDIPFDKDGNLKTVFLMNTLEGTYVRNITLWLPGEDRSSYDPDHNYLEDIKGTDYEFFIEALGGENSVKWDEALQVFHLTNKVTKQSDARGFIFNRDYLTNIIKHTNAESISFEFCTDGISSGTSSDDKTIYQGFYPDWWDKVNVKRHSVSSRWTKVEIYFDDIPLDEDGKVKTIFLMNTVEGMYIRNIKLYQPGDDRTEYDSTHNYLEDIKGTEYEFFIEPLGGENSVAWDEVSQSYHLTNKVTKQSNERGFIFNRDYLTNIMAHTNAESISFEFCTDGIASGLSTGDKKIYQGFYPDWWDKENVKSYSISNKWTKVEIFFEDIPLDADGNVKTIFLMNTVEGMYIRNIKLYQPGEERPADEPAYDVNRDYLADIEGTEYEFFIEPMSEDNSVKWDADMNAYHLINKETSRDATRGFIFSKEYLQGIMATTEAVSISFEYKTDGVSSGADTDDRTIYRAFWPDWWDAAHMTRTKLSDTWTKATINFADIPLDTDESIKTIFLMNTVEGMYVRNIKVNVPVVPSTTCDFVVDVETGRDPIVLQLTDTQIIDAAQERYEDRLTGVLDTYWATDQIEERCYDYLTEIITTTEPDLILITGDLTYGQFDDAGTSFASFVDFMDSFQIPWAPVFGNHEAETELGIDAYCDMLEAAEYCLFKQRELTGNGNYTVGIRQDGELKRVFFLLDSNGYTNPSAASLANGHTVTTTGFGKDQIEWYTETAQNIKEASPDAKISFAFHIQLAVFEDAYEKYGFDSSAVVDGSSGILSNPIHIDLLADKTEGDFGYIGRVLKGPWDSDYKVWEGLKALGVDSIFVGHEHCNSASVVYEGVRLQYGQKSSTYDRTNYVDESTGVITGAYYAATTPLVGGTVLPLDTDGALKNPYIYLCENAGGNIDWGTGDGPSTDYEYTTNIEGEEYEFFIEPLSDDNSVEWDADMNAYHLINKETNQDNTRGFLFSKKYLDGMIAEMKAVSISFEYKTDGISSGSDTDDRTIYQAFWPDWWDTDNMTRTKVSGEWQKATINFADIPLDTAGSMKTIFLMNTIEGMYVKNITFSVPNEYETVAEIDLTDADHTWTKSASTGLTGGNGKGTFSTAGTILKVSDCWVYAVHEVTFADAVTLSDNAEKIRFKMRATSTGTKDAANNLEVRFYNYDVEGGLGSSQCATYNFTSQGEWETVELDSSLFLNANNEFKGFAFALFGFGAWDSGEAYTLEFDKVEILGIPSTDEEVVLANASLSDTTIVTGANTGITGAAGGVSGYWHTKEDGITALHFYGVKKWYVQRITFAEALKVSGTDLKVRFTMMAVPEEGTTKALTLRFMNHDTTGALSQVAYTGYTFSTQNEWETVEFSLDQFLDEEGKFKGFTFATFDYEGKYDIRIAKIEIF